MTRVLVLAGFLATALGVNAQGLDPATILNPGGTWPTLLGDYTSRRYSPLEQINQTLDAQKPPSVPAQDASAAQTRDPLAALFASRHTRNASGVPK